MYRNVEKRGVTCRLVDDFFWWFGSFCWRGGGFYEDGGDETTQAAAWQEDKNTSLADEWTDDFCSFFVRAAKMLLLEDANSAPAP